MFGTQFFDLRLSDIRNISLNAGLTLLLLSRYLRRLLLTQLLFSWCHDYYEAYLHSWNYNDCYCSVDELREKCTFTFHFWMDGNGNPHLKLYIHIMLRSEMINIFDVDESAIYALIARAPKLQLTAEECFEYSKQQEEN